MQQGTLIDQYTADMLSFDIEHDQKLKKFELFLFRDSKICNTTKFSSFSTTFWISNFL